jgi:hypothetical protein
MAASSTLQSAVVEQVVIRLLEQFAASSTLQSAVVEQLVIRLLEQFAATQQMAQQATRPPARNV